MSRKKFDTEINTFDGGFDEDVHIFGLQTFKQIDNKFKQYVKEYSSAKNLDKGFKSIRFDLQKSSEGLSSDVLSPRKSSALQQTLSPTLEGSSKTQKKGAGQAFNFMDDGIKDEIKRKRAQKWVDDQEMIPKIWVRIQFFEKIEPQQWDQIVCNEFGIKVGTLVALPNAQQKENYIFDCIKESLQKDLEDLDKKQKLRQNQIAAFEKAYNRQKMKFKNDKADIFEWLKVNSTFKNLKKKLRSELVETINDHKNQKKIEDSIEDYRRSKEASLTANFASSAKIMLEDAPVINNIDLLVDVCGNNNSVAQLTKKLNSRNQAKHQQSASKDGFMSQTQPAETTQPSTMKASKTSQSFFSYTLNQQMSTFGSMAQEKNRNDQILTHDIQQMEFTDEEEKKNYIKTMRDRYKWNVDKEGVFFDYRLQSKQRMYNDTKSSSFNDVGFSPLIQASQMDEKSRLKRDNLLAKYMNGDYLTAGEFQFLANTSRSLNKHVDKQFLQSAVSHLDPDVIENIEVELSQKILEDYMKVKYQLKNARQEFLQSYNDQIIERVDKKDKQLKQKRKIENGVVEQQRTKKNLQNYVDEIVRKEIRDQAYQEYLQKQRGSPRFQEASANVDVGRYKEKFMRSTSQKIGQRKLQENSQYLKRISQVRTVPREKPDLKAKRHFYHPPSKVMLDHNKYQRDFLGLGTQSVDPLVQQRLHDSVDDYHLRISGAIKVKRKDRFQQYYSGGPNHNEDEMVFQGNYQLKDPGPEYKVTKKKEAILVKLQSYWRGFAQREQFHLEKIKNQDNIRMHERMKHLKDKSTGFLGVVLKAQDKLKPQIRIQKKTTYDAKKIDKHIKEFQEHKHFKHSLQEIDDNSLQQPPQRSSRKDTKFTNVFKGSILDNILDQRPGSPSHTNLIPMQKQTSQQQGQGQGHTYLSTEEDSKDIIYDRSSVTPHPESGKSTKRSRPLTAVLEKTKKLRISGMKKMDNSDVIKIVGNTSQSQIHAKELQQQQKPRPQSQNRARKTPDPLGDSVQLSISREEERIDNIKNKRPRKGLFLKHKKLFAAIQSNKLHLIHEAGFNYYPADVNVKDDSGNSPLYYAAKIQNKQICDYLLDLKADVNERCSEGNTPLHMAFKSNQVMIIIALIMKGGNLNICNDFGHTPLAYASEETLRILDLKHGVASFNPKKTSQYFSTDSHELPSTLDNNKLLNRYQDKEEQEIGVMEFNYEQPQRSEINVRRPESGGLQSYNPPQDRKKVFIVNTHA